MTPKVIMDNSLATATSEVGAVAEIVHWRPGLCKIARAEESSFDIGLNLKEREFTSVDDVNEYVRRLTGNGRPVPKAPAKTPFEKAQRLIYETIDASRKQRIEKCQQALAMYPGCADALVILSEYEKDPHARRAMLDEAVRAGEICLRDAGIALGQSRDHSGTRRKGDPDASLFWSGEARPYMRARLALAECLHDAGQSSKATRDETIREKAIGEYRSLLELNPMDNQGVRYLLLNALLETGTDAGDAEAAELLRRTRDDSSMWAYGKVFLAFKSGLRNATADGSLVVTRAHYSNPPILKVLRGEIPVPKRLPETYGYGTEDEALIYGALAMGYWTATPGALQWLRSTVDRITAGLPMPFGANAPSLRERIARLRRAAETGGKVAPADRHYARAVEDHPEFAAIWFSATALDGKPLVVGDVNPVQHVIVQAAVEEILDMPGSEDGSNPKGASWAMRGALDSTMRAGLSRHEAVHLLGYVYAFDWFLAGKNIAPLDIEALIARLRYVNRLASGEISPDPVLASPARNDPCPCGSGRKLKRCCGRDDGWPSPQVATLAREIKAGHGKVRSRQNLGLSPVIGDGKYARLEELIELPSGHPVVVLENTAAVAEALVEQGRDYQASWALRDNVELARMLAGDEHLVTALYDAVDTLGQVQGYEHEFSQYACELARMVDDPREASSLWSAAGEAFMSLGKWRHAEQALDRAMSTGNTHPGAKMVWARYLSQTGRRDEAQAAYREVIKDCASSIGPEYKDLAEAARDELKKLERKAARERRRN